jgi:hypothetical protein
MVLQVWCQVSLLVYFELLSYCAYFHFVIYSNLCIKIENWPLQIIMHPWYLSPMPPNCCRMMMSQTVMMKEMIKAALTFRELPVECFWMFLLNGWMLLVASEHVAFFLIIVCELVVFCWLLLWCLVDVDLPKLVICSLLHACLEDLEAGRLWTCGVCTVVLVWYWCEQWAWLVLPLWQWDCDLINFGSLDVWCMCIY